MQWAALIAWVLTAGGGFVLLARWLGRGGMQQREPGRIRPPLILGHFLLAASGLVIWIIYVIAESDALAWIALALLVIVAVLGWTMFFVWWRQRQRVGAPAAGTAQAGPATAAEQHFPVPVVALHGVLAVTTVLLVFLTAIGVGES
jgi:hypothetical protein